MGLSMYLERVTPTYMKIQEAKKKLINESEKIIKEFEHLLEKDETLSKIVEDIYNEVKKHTEKNISKDDVMDKIILQLMDELDEADGIQTLYFLAFPLLEYHKFTTKEMKKISNELRKYHEKIRQRFKELVPDKLNRLIQIYKEYESLLNQETNEGENLIGWFKNYAIHCWFIKNVQNGKHDCGYYTIRKETLEKLLETVNKVLETRDEKIALQLLPPSCQEYESDREIDELYYKGLEFTKIEVGKVLENWDELTKNGYVIQYHGC